MKKPCILLIDDNPAFIELFRCLPEAEAYDIVSFNSGWDALEFLKIKPADLVISDVQMPEMSGNELLTRVQDMDPDVPVILVTAYGSSENAIAAIRRGAYHYFEKPIDDKLDLFWVTVREALDKRRRMLEIEALRKEKRLQANSAAVTMVGKSAGMKKVFQSIREVADLPVTILIYGETGTGKELVARAIVELGNRRDRGFFAVNCNEFAPGVLESELFGHERGAFTGAVSQKRGLFEIADKGTLFMDEIANASPALQAKLLRVLETREFARVGGTSRITSDFRIIAATNTRLEAEVEKGRFRQDLLYRLNVYAIELPPLRERREDIPLLAQYYLNRFSQAYNRPARGISEKALTALGMYEWPGNVRELVNIIERAVITCRESMITTRYLPFEQASSIPMSHFNLEEMELYLIRQALKSTGFNKTKASEMLGISRKTLIEKVKRHHIEDVIIPD